MSILISVHFLQIKGLFLISLFQRIPCLPRPGISFQKKTNRNPISLSSQCSPFPPPPPSPLLASVCLAFCGFGVSPLSSVHCRTLGQPVVFYFVVGKSTSPNSRERATCSNICHPNTLVVALLVVLGGELPLKSTTKTKDVFFVLWRFR